MQEHIFTFSLIIRSEALVCCSRFQQVSVVITKILRELMLRADEKPEINFYTRLCNYISSFKISTF